MLNALFRGPTVAFIIVITAAAAVDGDETIDGNLNVIGSRDPVKEVLVLKGVFVRHVVHNIRSLALFRAELL